MGKVICMASAKGGSGKTTLTATLADLLSHLGKSVLMIDTDASTNGLTLLFLKEVTILRELALSKKQVAFGTYEFEPAPPLDRMMVLLPNGASLIPATYAFMNTEEVDIQGAAINLNRIVSYYRDKFDYIFLDAQAGSDQFSHISMRNGVADEVVIVSEYDPLSAAGVERLKALFREDLTYNRTWVLLNKMLPEFVQSFSDFLEVAKYLSPIPWDASVVKAYSRRKLATDLEYGNDFTLAVIQTIKGLLGEEIEKELNSWMEDKAQLIRSPLFSQLEDTKKLLQASYPPTPTLVSKLILRYFSNLSPVILTIILCFLLYLTLFDRKSFEAQTSVKEFLTFGAAIISITITMSMQYLERKKISKEDESETRYERDRLYKRLESLENLLNSSAEALIKNQFQGNKRV